MVAGRKVQVGSKTTSSLSSDLCSRLGYLILITINVENCTNIRAKFFVILYENCSINCYCNFNPCGIFESMTSFTPILNQDLEQGKLMAAVNSRK